MTLLSAADRVSEVAFNVGSGSVTMAGQTSQDLQTWAAGGLQGKTVPYTIRHRTSAQWEVGYGVYASGVLSRLVVLSNSLGTTGLVPFAAGACDVWNDAPAEKIILLDATSSHLTLPGGVTVAGAVDGVTSLTASAGITVTGGTTAVQALTATTGVYSGGVTAVSFTGALVNVLTFGVHLVGSSYNNSAAVTLSTDAASTNVVSTLVARDGSGNFAAGTITAALAGNASTATAWATARTIWGQSVNGTADVSGALTVATGGITVTLGGISVVAGTTAVQAFTATTGVFSSTVTAVSFTGALIGNASTATALQTARAINGVNFDGTAAITIACAAGTLTGTTLASNVVTSSLTTVGVLASPHMTGAVVDSGGFTVTAGTTAVQALTATTITSTNTHTLSLGTITASTPAFSSTATWNLVSTTFVHNFANITDTNSAAASLLAQWQVGGADKFKVDKAGNQTLAGGLTATTGDFNGARAGDYLVKIVSGSNFGLSVKSVGTTSAHDILNVFNNGGTSCLAVFADGHVVVNTGLTATTLTATSTSNLQNTVTVGSGGNGGTLDFDGGTFFVRALAARSLVLGAAGGTAITVSTAQAVTIASGLTIAANGITVQSGTLAAQTVTATTVSVSGANAADASIGATVSNGLNLQAKPGSGYDFALVKPAGAAYILRVPTGTANLEALGSFTVSLGLTVTAGGITVQAGASSFRALTANAILTVAENSTSVSALIQQANATGFGAKFTGGDGAGKYLMTVNDAADTVVHLRVSKSTTAGDTSLELFDVTGNATVRVTRGAADSGGTGFRALRIPN